MNLLGQLNSGFGKLIVMVTHDPRAAPHAKATRYLDKGTLLEAGATPAV